MKRSRGLRRTGFQRKRRKPLPPRRQKRDLAGEAAIDQYRQSHNRCAVCHWPRSRPGRWLELHHLMGRFRRGTYEIENVVMLCMDDHRGYHDGGSRSLSLGQILTAKRDEDGHVDLELLSWLRGKKASALSLEALPGWAIDERKRNAAWRS